MKDKVHGYLDGQKEFGLKSPRNWWDEDLRKIKKKQILDEKNVRSYWKKWVTWQFVTWDTKFWKSSI